LWLAGSLTCAAGKSCASSHRDRTRIEFEGTWPITRQPDVAIALVLVGHGD
jgi:hypothetical protein